MLTADDETADALAEFDFVMGEDSGSETDVTVIEVDGNADGLDEMDIHMPEEPTTQGGFDSFDCAFISVCLFLRIVTVVIVSI